MLNRSEVLASQGKNASKKHLKFVKFLLICAICYFFHPMPAECNIIKKDT